jgi:hypothetical protein
VYSSEANTLLVTLLHSIKDQCTILALFIKSASAITKPIWDDRSLLLANKESVNTRSYRVSLSSLINLRPLN